MLRSKYDFGRIMSQLGIKKGDVVIVAPCQQTERFVAGAQSMVEALYRLVGSEGTLISSFPLLINSDPLEQSYAHFGQLDELRSDLKALDIKAARMMYGNPIFTYMANMPMASFNRHPYLQLVAIGKYGKYVTRLNSLDFPYGLQGPFASLSEMNAKMLCIGAVNFDELRHGFSYNHQMAVVVKAASDQGQYITYLDYEVDYGLLADKAATVEPTAQVKVDGLLYQSYFFNELLNAFK